jgi:glutathione S-transferase
MIEIFGTPFPFTRDARARWFLEEVGVPYQKTTIDMMGGEQNGERYRAMCPTGKIPHLRDGDVSIFESGAILSYLAEKHADKGLAPAIAHPHRATYLQWMYFGASTLEQPAVETFVFGKARADQPGSPERFAAAKNDLVKPAAALEQAVAVKPFLLGEFSAADIMVGLPLVWAHMAGALAPYPKVAAYFARLSQRPAFKKTFAQ